MRFPYWRGSSSGRFLIAKRMYQNFDLDIENCRPYLLARCRYCRCVRKERFNCIIRAFVFNKKYTFSRYFYNIKKFRLRVLGRSVFKLLIISSVILIPRHKFNVSTNFLEDCLND